MNWQVEWLDEAKKDMRKLGKAEQIQVLKGIEKVRTNPLPPRKAGMANRYAMPNERNFPGFAKSDSGISAFALFTNRYCEMES